MPEVNPTDLILKCIAALADVRAQFRGIEIAVEKRGNQFSAVSVDVIPFVTSASEYAKCGVTLSVALNCELRTPISADKQAIGMDVLIRHSNGVWVSEYELGWSGQAVGWDAFDSTTVESATIEECIDGMAGATSQLCGKFLQFVKELENPASDGCV